MVYVGEESGTLWNGAGRERGLQIGTWLRSAGLGLDAPTWSRGKAGPGAGTVVSDGEKVTPRGGQIRGSCELKLERACLGCHLALA